MQHPYSRRYGLFLFCLLAFVSFTASAGTYTLTDGTKIEGDPISETDNGVIFHASNGSDIPRIGWDKLTQESIRALLARATTPREKALLEPLIEELPRKRRNARKSLSNLFNLRNGRPRTWA